MPSFSGVRRLRGQRRVKREVKSARHSSTGSLGGGIEIEVETVQLQVLLGY